MEKRYDPGENPDSKDWLALDGEQKLRLIQQYHRKNGIRLRNSRLHALIHAAVENQVALGNRIARNIRGGKKNHVSALLESSEGMQVS